MKARALLLIGVVISTQASGQKKSDVFDLDKKYPADSARHWTKSTMIELSKKHPGFYRYTSKQKFDFIIDSTLQTINDSLTELSFYRKLKPLFAQIGCLHTSIVLSDSYQDYLNRSSTLIPIEVFITSDRRVFVAKNYSKISSIRPRSEIVSINGKPMKKIINTLINNIPSDGHNESLKILLLNHRFAFWYQTIIEVSSTFQVTVLADGTPETYILEGVAKETFPTLEFLEGNYKKALEFDVKNTVGILSIRSFANSDIKKSDQNFRKFVRSAVKTLQNKNINTLILDLRYNTGGTDGNAAFLASYFFEKPFRYWERIEVTESVALEIKGIYKLFYGKPVHVDSLFLWRKSWLTKEFDFYETQKPADQTFKGKVYILANGLCMSSCADLIAILAHNSKATIVGQETGGGFQGNTSGLMPSTKIPTGLIITVPLLKYTNAVDVNRNKGAGTVPDHIVMPTLDDWMEKKDVEMRFVETLIANDIN